MNAKKLLLLVPLVLTSACTTAGPFVTSISSDGRGNLIVEKSMVKMNSFTGTVSNEGSSTTVIRLSEPSRISQDTPPDPVWTGNR